MFYIYDLTTKEVLVGTNNLTSLEVLKTNYTNIDTIESDIDIPVRYQGRWIVNANHQLENITT